MTVETITLKDRQEIGKPIKGWRPMTEQEIAVFYIVPSGAIRYPDIKAWDKACQELAERNVHYQAGGHHPEFGSFWAYEVK